VTDHLYSQVMKAKQRAEVVRVAFVADPVMDGKKAFSLMVGSILIDLMEAWFLMLGMMAAQNDWHALPAPGYWNCFLVVLGLNAIGISVRGPWRTVRT
jgi:hypothetical protein